MTDMTLKKAQPRLNNFEHAVILGHECYSLGNVGQLEFKAPEVLEDKPYSFKSDCWSYGMVVYNLLTKKHPYKFHIAMEDQILGSGPDLSLIEEMGYSE